MLSAHIKHVIYIRTNPPGRTVLDDAGICNDALMRLSRMVHHSVSMTKTKLGPALRIEVVANPEARETVRSIIDDIKSMMGVEDCYSVEQPVLMYDGKEAKPEEDDK